MSHCYVNNTHGLNETGEHIRQRVFVLETKKQISTTRQFCFQKVARLLVVLMNTGEFLRKNEMSGFIKRSLIVLYDVLR